MYDTAHTRPNGFFHDVWIENHTLFESPEGQHASKQLIEPEIPHWYHEAYFHGSC